MCFIVNKPHIHHNKSKTVFWQTLVTSMLHWSCFRHRCFHMNSCVPCIFHHDMSRSLHQHSCVSIYSFPRHFIRLPIRPPTVITDVTTHFMEYWAPQAPTNSFCHQRPLAKVIGLSFVKKGGNTCRSTIFWILRGINEYSKSGEVVFAIHFSPHTMFRRACDTSAPFALM
jgi:hypothetical protein